MVGVVMPRGMQMRAPFPCTSASHLAAPRCVTPPDNNSPPRYVRRRYSDCCAHVVEKQSKRGVGSVARRR